MKLSLISTSLLVLGLVLSGCTNSSNSGSPSSTPAPSQSPAASSDFSVALLTPGSVSDAGWNALAYDGLKSIEKDLGAKVSNEVVSDTTKIKDAMRQYGQGGTKLVFGHGFEYNEPAVEIGKDFPNTIYISSSGGKTAVNVGAFRFYLEQSFYLAGMVAASMSKSGKIAAVGGLEVPSIASTFKAFKAGAQSVNPKIQCNFIYVGSFDDQAKMKQATEAAITEGADFIIHQANQSAKAVFEACAEKKVYAFGANADQNAESDAVLASAVIKAGPAFLQLAKQVKEGKYKGEVTLVGYKDGAIDFVINPKLKDKIPADVLKKVEETTAKIKSGELTVPKDNF